MEGAPHKAAKTEFTECWRTSWKTPYIMRLAFSAGIGGLLFGYDTGVISGALLYIVDDFKSVDKHTWLQETIVSMAVAGAIFGAAFGGWFNDKYGRRKSILLADILFFIGAIVMAVAPAPWVIIIGRVLVGLGVGMASMTSPLYISEASPARIRGALVSTNGLLITGGQFLSYLINLAFTRTKGTWRWMLGVASIPAFVQFILMLSLPESPRWLYRADKKDEARAILEKIYPAHEVEEEMKALQTSIEVEKADEEFLGNGVFSKVKSAWSNTIVRRGLYAGITVQVAQQFVGINTVMYYSPTIVQLAGFASNKTALALSLITSGLNAVGSIISMCFVDRYGRRRLMIVSMFGIITCLVVLSVLFMQASIHSPRISAFESNHFGSNSTCSAFLNAPGASSWNCMSCLQASTDCAFCSNGNNKYHPGACLSLNDNVKGLCRSEKREWFTKGCPSKFGFFAVILLGLYKTLAGEKFTFNYIVYVWAPYGQLWRILRRLTVVELFSSQSLSKSCTLRDEEIATFIRSLYRFSTINYSSKKVDLTNWAFTLVFNLMTKIIAGKHIVNEQDAGMEKGIEIIEKLRGTFLVTISFLNMIDFLPILRWFGYKGLEKKMDAIHNKRNEFLNTLLDEFRHNKISGLKSNSNTLIETLLSFQESEPEFYTDDIIKSIMLVVFVAGTETSSSTIQWVMRLLLAHPEVLHKLRADIDNKVGNKRLVRESDLTKLPYLRCVVNETMRLYPPVPLLLPHYSTEDCTVGGYDVPKHTMLLINAWAVHRDPKVWDDPEKFKPERFEATEGETERFNYKLIPFGMGRRACPGTDMGLRAVSLALGALIQCFEWQIEEEESLEASYHARMSMQNKPLKAICTPRKDLVELLSQL